MELQTVIDHMNRCDQAVNYSRPTEAYPNGDVLSVVFKPYPHQPHINELEAIEVLRENGIRARSRFITVDGKSVEALKELGVDLKRSHDLGKTKYGNGSDQHVR
jgi:hypothetical protein